VDCCAALVCIGGACQVGGDVGSPPDESTGGVTTLPDTGIGDSRKDSDSHWGATLAGGLAALLGAKKLRDRQGTADQDGTAN
jgi:hypothetical protein